MNGLSSVQLDRIEEREDFQEIMGRRFPWVCGNQWVSSVLHASIAFLDRRLAHFRSYMLDYKPFSVRQLFTLMARVDSFLMRTFKLEELCSSHFYLASRAR